MCIRDRIERTFDYWNRNLGFYKLPFPYKQRWFNVEMQSGREVVEPRTLANIPVPMMRELGEETGLYVPDYIIFYYYEQYSHLHQNRKVVLNGDCTLLIRDYVKIMGGNKPDPGKQVIVKWKPVPIPARHIRRYIKENFLSLVELDRVTGSDVIDHCLSLIHI